MHVVKYVIYFLEIATGLFLAWLLTSYVFLSFWANQWVFNDIIAWTTIVIVGVIMIGLMWTLHHFVIRRLILE